METGQATPFALNALFFNLPRILVQPIAGSIADRYNRKKIMILADTGAALSTAVVAALLFSGNLEIWHIYVTTLFSSVFSTFQGPAYRASITMIVPKKDLARAGGIEQVGGAVESILVPLIASVLYAAIGLKGVILIDFVTYFFAIGALLLVFIPQPELTTQVEEAGQKPSMWRDAAFGWKYLRERPGLFGLLWYYAVVNFFLSFSGVLWGPLILSFGTEIDLGVVQMSSGLGILLGGILIGAWGGPEGKKIRVVIATIALSSVGYFIAGLRETLYFVAVGQFVVLFFIPISAALSQAVWQVKVPPDIQGRVFSIRSMIAWSIIPLANAVAGPLADNVFQPLMAEGGALANTFVSTLVGSGEARGIGLMFLVSAVFLMATSLLVFTYPRVRNLEDEIPDAVPDEPEEEQVVEGEAAAEAVPSA
jgi:hypothetical protein